MELLGMARVLAALLFFAIVIPAKAGPLLLGEIDAGAFSTSTPTPTCSAGSFTSASASVRYKQIGKIVLISVVVSITTNGTCATAINVPLPVAPVANDKYELVGIAGNVMVQGTAQTTPQVNIKKYDGTYPGADATNIILSGFYEAQ